MFSSKFSNWSGILILVVLTITVYWEFYLLGKIPMPGDTVIGAYFPWLDYKWGFPVGVPVKNALISDVFSQFFLWKYLIIDIFKQGQIPLWNNYSLSGTPFLATYHSAVFNPFNLLLFLPKFYGWGLFISLQTFSAMLGMFLLLDLYVKNFWAKIFGAIIFSLSGLMTTWVEFGTGVWAASMLPWIFLFLEKYFNSKNLRYLFFMSLSFVILYLSGHAQLTLYSTILTFIYLFTKYLKQKNPVTTAIPAIFIILSILFCSFQFLPTYEFTKDSIRSNESYSSSFNYGLNPPYEIVKIFSADFFGNPTTNNYWDSQSYHEQSMFLGTIPVILILSLIIFQLKKKQFNFWIGTFLASLLLGFASPITELLYSLPLPFLTYSSAARIFFLTSFSGGILAAIALENLTEDKFKKLLTKTNLYFFVTTIGLVLGFIALIISYQKLPAYPELLKDTENYKVTIKNLIIPTAIAFICLTLLLVLRFKPKLKNFTVIILVLITFIDLTRYFYKYNPFISQSLVFPKTPITDFLQNKKPPFRIARLDSEVMPPNTWTNYRLESIEGYDPLLSENYARLFNLVNNLNYGSTLSRYRELDNFNIKYLDALNVKYLLSVKRDEKNNVKGDLYDPKIKENNFQTIFEDQTTVISENPNVLNRAYFVSKVQSLENKKSLVSIISSKNFDPRTEALITESLNIPEVTGQGNIEILNYSPNEIEFKTQTKNNEFLILADTFNKGWKLTRNGNPEKIYETNLALRGLTVPSGENYFVMEYFPDSFKYGLWLSTGSLLLLITILFYSIKSKKI